MSTRALLFTLALSISTAAHAASNSPAPTLATDSSRLTNDATLSKDTYTNPNTTTANPVAPLIAADHQAVEEATRQLAIDSQPPALPMRIRASQDALDKAKKKLARDQKACQLVATQNGTTAANVPECR